MASRKSREGQVKRVRNSILGGVAAISLLVVGYGLLYSTGATQGEILEGTHYRILDSYDRRRPGEAVKVQEFFSYGCIHCKNFDPLIERWLTDLPEGVSFSRSPVAFSPSWTLLAQTYFTLEYLKILDPNHSRLFRQIHNNRRQFTSADEVAEFIDGNGATKEEFLRAFNSPDVRRAIRESDADQRNLAIASVPTMVVAGKYVVNMDNGRKVALEVVDHLLMLEQRLAEPEKT